MADVIAPVLQRYGRHFGDIAIREDILSEIQNAIASDDLEALSRFLSEDRAYWLSNIQWAYFQRFDGVEPLDGYAEWAKTKCDLLISIARKTRDDDGIIQHLVNYEDFHVEVFPFLFGPQFIVTLYELRGLDFFLFHYMGGETTGHDDKALFEHAEFVGKALNKLGRTSEANAVIKDIIARKERLMDIQKDFQGPEYDPSSDILQRIKIVSERFWSEYLTPDVWVRLDNQSRSEMVDAFSTEYLLKQEVLSTWSAVALMLCKVVEREISKALFLPWKTDFSTAAWNPPQASSEKVRKRIESRFMTFKTLQSCASEKGHSPTLGQLLFLAKFWNDSIMDQCTDIFVSIRCRTEHVSPCFSNKVANLVSLLEQPIIPNGTGFTIPDARNRSAHPREDENIEWPLFLDCLKQLLGKPPAELLRLVVLELSISRNIA